MVKGSTAKYESLLDGRTKRIISAILRLQARYGEGAGIVRAEDGNLVMSSGAMIPHGRIGSKVIQGAIEAMHFSELGSWKNGCLNTTKAVQSAARHYLNDRHQTPMDILNDPRYELWSMDTALSIEGSVKGKVKSLFMVEYNPFDLISITPLDFRANGDSPRYSSQHTQQHDGMPSSGVRFNRALISDAINLSYDATDGMKQNHGALVDSIRQVKSDHDLIAAHLSEREIRSIPNLADTLNASFALTLDVLKEAAENDTLDVTIGEMNTYLSSSIDRIKEDTRNIRRAPEMALDGPTQPSPGMAM